MTATDLQAEYGAELFEKYQKEYGVEVANSYAERPGTVKSR